jgi:hypothetical protein
VKKDLEDVQSPKETPKRRDNLCLCLVRNCRTVRALIIRLYFTNEEATIVLCEKLYAPISTNTIITFCKNQTLISAMIWPQVSAIETFAPIKTNCSNAFMFCNFDLGNMSNLSKKGNMSNLIKDASNVKT